MAARKHLELESARSGAPRYDDPGCTASPTMLAPVPAMSAPFDRDAVIRRAAADDAPRWITGPSGAGKRHLTRAIHDASPRTGRSFTALDCRGAAPIASSGGNAQPVANRAAMRDLFA